MESMDLIYVLGVHGCTLLAIGSFDRIREAYLISPSPAMSSSIELINPKAESVRRAAALQVKNKSSEFMSHSIGSIGQY
jgi:hypothetical protein